MCAVPLSLRVYVQRNGLSPIPQSRLARIQPRHHCLAMIHMQCVRSPMAAENVPSNVILLGTHHSSPCLSPSRSDLAEGLSCTSPSLRRMYALSACSAGKSAADVNGPLFR